MSNHGVPTDLDDQIEEEIRRIHDYIRDAHDEIRDGTMVDITMIEGDMNALTEMIFANPNRLNPFNEKLMDKLRAELDSLFQTLEDIYDTADKVH